MSYVDGFIIPVQKKKLQSYRRIAQKEGKVCRHHGALDYKESIDYDLNVECGIPFPRLVKLKPGGTVVFSYIVFKSCAHRDRVNAKVIKDSRLARMLDPKSMPFDCKRMVYVGFKIIVDS